MKHFIIYCLLLGLPYCTGKKEESGCEQFRNGKFILTQQPAGVRYEIERKDSIQTEYNTRTDSVVVFRIKWNNDCEYEVVKTQKRKRSVDGGNAGTSTEEFKDAIPVKVRIITTGKDYYVFESRMDGVDFTYEDTMWTMKAGNK